MTFKRFFRLAAIGGAVAAGVAAVRALTRDKDPLPSPASGPSEPWPPLREATAPDKVEVPEDPTDGADDEARTADVVDEPAEKAPEPLLNVVAHEPDPEPEPGSQPEPEADDESDGQTPKAAAAKRRRSRPLRAAWMPPNEDGSCPDGYPLKANDQSMIFHAPGQMSYDRTVPERCYADAEAAVADGYRAAKR